MVSPIAPGGMKQFSLNDNTEENGLPSIAKRISFAIWPSQIVNHVLNHRAFHLPAVDALHLVIRRSVPPIVAAVKISYV
jgi:hypothetical protein